MHIVKVLVTGFYIIILIGGLTSCRPQSALVTEETAMSSTAPLEATPDIEITFGQMQLDVRQIDIETVFQKNCGGNETIENEIEKRRVINHLIEVGAGYEVNANGAVGLPGGVASVGLGAAVTGQFGFSYGFSEEIARSIRVRARPGTHMEHRISLQEVWKIGEALMVVNGQEYRIPFSYKSSFSIELIDSKDLSDCPLIETNQTALVAAIPTESVTALVTAESTATPTTVAPTPTSQVIDEVPLNEIVVLSENSNNTYNWEQGAPNVTTQVNFEGSVAFIPTGNNFFRKELVTIGYEKHEARFVNVSLYLLKREAGLLLQLQFDDSWEHRWGFDGRASYQGVYNFARRGQTLNMPVGEWVEIKLDLIDDLGGRPGQVIRGMAFSAQDGNMIYDYVTFTSSPRLTSCLPPSPDQLGDAESITPTTIILSNTPDNTYAWQSGSPYITTQVFYEGDSAFIPNGNNTLVKNLGTVGNEDGEIRYITMKVCLFKKEAGLLLQLLVDTSWEHRWGLDGRSNYQGVYNHARRGQSPNLPVGEWVVITLDLIDDLGARFGQVINGMAFSAADGNMVYDHVGFLKSQ